MNIFHKSWKNKKLRAKLCAFGRKMKKSEIFWRNLERKLSFIFWLNTEVAKESMSIPVRAHAWTSATVKNTYFCNTTSEYFWDFCFFSESIYRWKIKSVFYSKFSHFGGNPAFINPTATAKVRKSLYKLILVPSVPTPWWSQCQVIISFTKSII